MAARISHKFSTSLSSSGHHHADEGGGGHPLSRMSLSRRPSVLLDLFSLFRRRSSSVGGSGRRSKRGSALMAAERHLLNATGERDVDEAEAFLSAESEDEDGNISKERLLEQIRQKKEVIGKLRSQDWSMRRKRRTLKVAQRYLQKHESKVSKAHLYKEEILRRWTLFVRWFNNVRIYLIPWEAKIKRIESHFGSVVSSYFTFLRWVLGVNVTMTLIVMMFVTIPEMLADSRNDAERFNKTYTRKVMPPHIFARANELHTVWDYGGHLQYSLIFYGYYSNETYFGDTIQYHVPVAYFLVNLFLLGYSFFTILRKMAENARASKLASGKTEQYVFNWRLFALGWDFTIGNPETASNTIMANVNRFRESIAEYRVKIHNKFDCMRLFLRLLANVLILTMLALSVWTIQAVSQITEKDTFIKQNAVSITVSFITLIFPNIFELIGRLERWHPRFALRLQLARVLCLYIVNYYTVIFSLFLMKESVKHAIESRDRFDLSSRMRRNSNNFSEIANVSLENILFNRSTRHVYDMMMLSSDSQPSWTTVMPNFGPLAVANAKAMLKPHQNQINPTGKDVNSYETRQVGPLSDWSMRRHSTGPPPLTSEISPNSNSTPIFVDDSKTIIGYAQRFTTDAYDEASFCWETMIGQEIAKLVTMDMVMTLFAVLFIDFFRGLWVRYCNSWWCWNLETTVPEYGEFKVAENVLHLVNNQGMVWLGMFFVPMLPAINNLKLIVLMYIRGWAVMTCNVPAQQIFRASRSSNFYLILLLLMLFLCTLPVGFVIASERPSRNCGPFGQKDKFYHVITDLLNTHLNKSLVEVLRYITSPGIVIPVLLLLLLIIYFLVALVRGLREANYDLQHQLLRERTEEKKKIFELAGGKRNKHNKQQQQRREPPEPVKIGAQSEDDDGGGGDLNGGDNADSHSSLSRSVHSKNHFVPSLRSVHEVDNSSDFDEDTIKHQSNGSLVNVNVIKSFATVIDIDDHPIRIDRSWLFARVSSVQRTLGQWMMSLRRMIRIRRRNTVKEDDDFDDDEDNGSLSGVTVARTTMLNNDDVLFSADHLEQMISSIRSTTINSADTNSVRENPHMAENETAALMTRSFHNQTCQQMQTSIEWPNAPVSAPPKAPTRKKPSARTKRTQTLIDDDAQQAALFDQPMHQSGHRSLELARENPLPMPTLPSMTSDCSSSRQSSDCSSSSAFVRSSAQNSIIRRVWPTTKHHHHRPPTIDAATQVIENDTEVTDLDESTTDCDERTTVAAANIPTNAPSSYARFFSNNCRISICSRPSSAYADFMAWPPPPPLPLLPTTTTVNIRETTPPPINRSHYAPRFRISVSPTRRKLITASGSDTDSSSIVQPRKYIIRVSSSLDEERNDDNEEQRKYESSV